MALTLVGGTVAPINGSAWSTASGTSITWPTVQANDLAVLLISAYGGTSEPSAGTDPGYSTPTGFTQQWNTGSAASLAGTNSAASQCFTKWAAGNEGGTSITVPNLTNGQYTFTVYRNPAFITSSLALNHLDSSAYVNNNATPTNYTVSLVTGKVNIVCASFMGSDGSTMQAPTITGSPDINGSAYEGGYIFGGQFAWGAPPTSAVLSMHSSATNANADGIVGVFTVDVSTANPIFMLI